ncbi:helix-turn-helix domain-containing protein [Arthrobacter sp. LAR12-1-1.1]|uniref:helix-turn-helix domain-containing protein n=1 Tax=Arthrobacter sp. LAR12-1-1.1 TaxID=3135215 RepID=UPI0034324C59
MNRTRSRLLHFLSKSGPSSSTQIATGIGLSPSTVRKHLSVLVLGGCVEVSRGEHARSTAALYSANAGRIQERIEAAQHFTRMDE